MADVGIELVREFFEAHQFLVKINRKYIPTKKDREKISEADLAVLNLKPQPDRLRSFVLSADDIDKLSRAIVKVKGWHTETFCPSVLTGSPKIFRFISPGVIKLAAQFFGTKDFARILVVPCLPADREMKARSIDILREKGVDGVIEFKLILKSLTKMVRINRNYLESDTLQLIRLFKVYDILKGGQLELFSAKKNRK